jgi:L-lactate dehydrogenase complex protein LldG
MDEALVRKFTERAQEQDAEVLCVESGAVPATAAKIATEAGLKTFCVSRGLPDSIKGVLREAGLEESQPPADIAVTGVSWAVAETGTLLIRGMRRQFITAEVHIAVVDGSSVLGDLDDIQLAGDEAPCITLVTGPSRTADIERVLVLGAHGPRRLVVIIEKP